MTEQRVQKMACEVRELPGQPPVISGYAAKFNSRSNLINGAFIEQVDPGAFNRSLNNKDVLGTFNHNMDNILGRTGNGTMRLYTDDTGLRYDIEVNPDDPQAQSVLAKVRRGDVQGSSFSFQTTRDEWNMDVDPPERRLLEVDMHELGPVTMPAYPDTTAMARSALEPLAGRIGEPVESLIAALEVGPAEFRALVNGGTMTETEERAVWSTAFKNNLPDSSFLYIESGGSKDSDGKTTPRTLRHFPYKDGSGKVDLPHLRNALARIPQSNLPDSVKSSVTAKAEKLLAANGGGQNSLDEDVEERAGKKISAATASQIQAAIDGLRDLLDVAKSGAPADSEIGDMDQDLPDDEQDSDEPDSERDLVDVAKKEAPEDHPSAASGGRSLNLLAAEVEVRRRVAELEAA